MIRFCSFCMAAFSFFFLFKFELLCFNSCKAFKWFVLNRNVVNSLLSNIANFLDFYCSFHQLKQYKGKTNKKAFLLFSNGQKFKIWSSEEEKKVFLFEFFFTVQNWFFLKFMHIFTYLNEEDENFDEDFTFSPSKN